MNICIFTMIFEQVLSIHYHKHHLKDKSSCYWNAKWFNEAQYCKLCLVLIFFIIKGVQYQISLTSWLTRECKELTN